MEEAGAQKTSVPMGTLSVLTVVEQATRDTWASVMVIDASGLCGWLNPGTKKLFGVADGSALVGRLNLWQHCTIPGDPQGEALERAFRGEPVELPVLEYHLASLVPEKSSFPPIRVSAKLLPLLDEVGGLMALYVFNRQSESDAGTDGASSPWSQDSREDRELRRCIAVAKAFAGKIAHDFNNQIAVMQGFASILQNRLREDEQNRGLADQIEQAGGESLKLTDWLSRFANDLPPEPVPLELNQLVREVLETKLEDKPADIEVAVDFDAPSSIVSADRDRLARLCQALWQKAVEAMPQGGTLSWSTKLDSAPAGLLTELETENQSPFIRLRVSDTGLGMDEKTKAQIFDPFFTSKAGKGRGLGLTEVYETVADLRGFIEVASQPGQGACVEIYLPVAVGSLSAAADVAVAERPKRLLVVDDEAMLREILKNFLEQEGYEVVAAAAGEEALQICSRPGENIDAVILDMTLPGIDGMETFNGLKAINDQIKVVIATGDPYRQSVHDLMRQGASGMLSKPFRPQHLSEVIKQVLA